MKALIRPVQDPAIDGGRLVRFSGDRLTRREKLFPGSVGKKKNGLLKGIRKGLKVLLPGPQGQQPALVPVGGLELEADSSSSQAPGPAAATSGAAVSQRPAQATSPTFLIPPSTDRL